MENHDSIFIDEPKHRAPYEGCLVVFNIGQHNYNSLGMTKQFEEEFNQALADAHASGWLVYFVFDDKRGASLPPEHMNYFQDMDIVGLSGKIIGKDTIDVSLLPDQRIIQFRDIIERIRSQPDIKILTSSAMVTGLCKIDGDEVFIPPTVIK